MLEDSGDGSTASSASIPRPGDAVHEGSGLGVRDLLPALTAKQQRGRLRAQWRRRQTVRSHLRLPSGQVVSGLASKLHLYPGLLDITGRLLQLAVGAVKEAVLRRGAEGPQVDGDLMGPARGGGGQGAGAGAGDSSPAGSAPPQVRPRGRPKLPTIPGRGEEWGAGEGPGGPRRGRGRPTNTPEELAAKWLAGPQHGRCKGQSDAEYVAAKLRAREQSAARRSAPPGTISRGRGRPCAGEAARRGRATNSVSPHPRPGGLRRQQGVRGSPPAPPLPPLRRTSAAHVGRDDDPQEAGSTGSEDPGSPPVPPVPLPPGALGVQGARQRHGGPAQDAVPPAPLPRRRGRGTHGSRDASPPAPPVPPPRGVPRGAQTTPWRAAGAVHAVRGSRDASPPAPPVPPPRRARGLQRCPQAADEGHNGGQPVAPTPPQRLQSIRRHGAGSGSRGHGGRAPSPVAPPVPTLGRRLGTRDAVAQVGPGLDPDTEGSMGGEGGSQGSPPSHQGPPPPPRRRSTRGDPPLGPAA